MLTAPQHQNQVTTSWYVNDVIEHLPDGLVKGAICKNQRPVELIL